MGSGIKGEAMNGGAVMEGPTVQSSKNVQACWESWCKQADLLIFQEKTIATVVKL